MAISYIGGTSADSTTTSLPAAAAAGDLAIVCAARQNSSGPSLATGYTSLGVIAGGSGGSQHGQLVGWKILDAADITAGNVGTWTGATKVLVLVYRGASGVSANHSGTGASGTTLTFPARSSLTSGSWVVAVASHRTATNVLSMTATDYTNRSSGFGGSTEIGGMDTNGAVASVVQRTFTANASSGNVGRTMEVTESSAPPAITGTGGLSFAVTAPSGNGKESFKASGGNSWSVTAPDATAKLAFITSGGLSWGVTASDGDGALRFTGTGGNSWLVTAIDGTGNVPSSGHTGTGALSWAVTEPAATGKETFSGTGGNSWEVTALSGSGELGFTGTGGLSWGVTTLNATGALSFDGTGGLSWNVTAPDSTGKETFTGTGGNSWNVTDLDGTGTVSSDSFTGTGALSFPVTTSAGDGTVEESFTGTGGLSLPVTAISADGTVTGIVVETGAGGGAAARRAYDVYHKHLLEKEKEREAREKQIPAITGEGSVSFKRVKVYAKAFNVPKVPKRKARQVFTKQQKVTGAGTFEFARKVKGKGTMDLTPIFLRDDDEALMALFGVNKS